MSTPAAWPAIGATELDISLSYERGVFGKQHGERGDYRWLLTSPGLTREVRPELLEILACKVIDSERPLWWQAVDDCWLLGACAHSRARDADGRQGFVELQVIELGRAGAPAALAAAMLLPRAESGSETWSQLPGEWWTRPEPGAEAAPDLLTAVEVPCSGLGDVISRGIGQLCLVTSLHELARFYSDLLGDQAAAVMRGLSSPLPAEAMAALLLPLPRKVADQASLVCRLATESSDLDQGGGSTADVGAWEVVGSVGPGGSAEESSEAASDELSGEVLARALLEQAPELLSSCSGQVSTVTGQAATGLDEEPIRLALWGPSSSGKTVLLAQLYLDAQLDDSPWTVLPEARSQAFLDQHRREMAERRRFPEATREGADDAIEYTFRRQGADQVATLALEDRAGATWERLDEVARERLLAADGLALVFDPTRGNEKLRSEIERTLLAIHMARQSNGEPDPRPVALCLTKADLLVAGPDELELAISDPDGFVRGRIDRRVILEIERFCGCYALFPVSAVGVRARCGLVRPAMFYDESLSPRLLGDGQPFNLLRPFTWLIETTLESRA